MKYLTVLILSMLIALSTISTAAFAGITADTQSVVFEAEKKKDKKADEEPECD